MAETLMTLAVVLTLLGNLFSIVRLVRGPTPIDRVIAIDVLTITSITIIVLLAHFGARFIYVDVAIVYGLLSFLGVLAVARYSEKGF
ncbi:MAG: cation:proton antiporter [Candidatus Thiosymbion ectosymbiont of Robbea hypermnestra]|nr:cation:proton antiporter [Candidatus Thiosymbion ectosymbiont of Robbea hypermnestra]